MTSQQTNGHQANGTNGVTGSNGVNGSNGTPDLGKYIPKGASGIGVHDMVPELPFAAASPSTVKWRISRSTSRTRSVGCGPTKAVHGARLDDVGLAGGHVDGLHRVGGRTPRQLGTADRTIPWSPRTSTTSPGFTKARAATRQRSRS